MLKELSADPMEALSAAVKAKDPGRVRDVLARGLLSSSQIDEPLPGYSFDTPAMVAAVQQDDREMVDALLASGANINARSKWWAGGFGVLDLSSDALTPYLIERGAYIDIHAAARLGFFERVKELVNDDPELVRARGGDGQTPLHFAANVEIAAYLLEHGAQIDERDIDHESTAAQYMAAHWPHRHAVARYLISRGAQTDILMAAALGEYALVEQQLDVQPASVLFTVSEEDLPKSDPESGGSIYIYGFGWGKTPHALARDFGHEDVFELLMKRSPVWLQIAQACEAGDETLAQQLLLRQPDFAQSMPNEAASRIVGAASRNDAPAVRQLLRAGWAANATGQHHQTPLHWASWHGNAEMVLDLLQHNASTEAREMSFKGAPLDWALHGSLQSGRRDKKNYGSVVQLLLKAGAEISGPIDDLQGSEEALAALRRFRATLGS